MPKSALSALFAHHTQPHVEIDTNLIQLTA